MPPCNSSFLHELCNLHGSLLWKRPSLTPPPASEPPTPPIPCSLLVDLISYSNWIDKVGYFLQQEKAQQVCCSNSNSPLGLSSLQVLAEGLEVVLLPLELCGGVDLAGAHLLDGHLHVVHPLHHLGVPAGPYALSSMLQGVLPFTQVYMFREAYIFLAILSLFY